MEAFWNEFGDQIPAAVELVVSAYLLFLGSWPLFLILERLAPAGERTPRSNFLFNWKIVLSNLALTPLLYALAVAITMSISKSWGLPLLPYPAANWSLGVPLLDAFAHGLVLFTTAVFLNDLWYYWWHRMQHEIPALWELHKLHHSDRNLNATTLYRSHFIELAGQALVRGITVGLVFDLSDVPQSLLAIIMAGLLPPVWDAFIHANLRFDALRHLLPYLSTPQFHWIHHSNLREHQDKNYAIWLPLFDVIFGTYYRPETDEYPPTGLSSGEEAGSVWQEQTGPFVAWGRMLEGGPERIVPD